jgi:hypothetical protein
LALGPPLSGGFTNGGVEATAAAAAACHWSVKGQQQPVDVAAITPLKLNIDPRYEDSYRFSICFLHCAESWSIFCLRHSTIIWTLSWGTIEQNFL